MVDHCRCSDVRMVRMVRVFVDGWLTIAGVRMVRMVRMFVDGWLTIAGVRMVRMVRMFVVRGSWLGWFGCSWLDG
jgi:thiosulfate reductase cytochrome b subunit